MCRLTIHNPSHEPPQRTPPSGFVVSCLVVQHSPKSERRGPYPFGFGRPCDGNRAGWRRSEFPAMKKSGQVLVRTMSSQSDELPKGSRGMSGVLKLGGGRSVQSPRKARSLEMPAKRTASMWGVWRDVHVGRCGSAPFPSLVRRGGRAAPGVVCSKSRSHLTDVREALLINSVLSSLNRPPQPSLREGIPALLRRGMG